MELVQGIIRCLWLVCFWPPCAVSRVLACAPSPRLQVSSVLLTLVSVLVIAETPGDLVEEGMVGSRCLNDVERLPDELIGMPVKKKT